MREKEREREQHQPSVLRFHTYQLFEIRSLTDLRLVKQTMLTAQQAPWIRLFLMNSPDDIVVHSIFRTIYIDSKAHVLWGMEKKSHRAYQELVLDLNGGKIQNIKITSSSTSPVCSYTGSRPASNMVIVDVKMVSGFIPLKATVRKVGRPDVWIFCLLRPGACQHDCNNANLHQSNISTNLTKLDFYDSKYRWGLWSWPAGEI